MINVNQITSQLARMPDQALQQYAAMHKNDPYTISLALSESNRRKQLRNASQGAQGMQPQPKVVDQAVAGMSPQPQMQPQMPQGQAQAMPEDTGIAQLPAGNMNFAEGGIIGYAGGGVARFDIGGEVDAARARRQAAQRALYGYGSRQRQDDPQGFSAAQAEFEAAKADAAAAKKAYETEMSGTGMNRAATNMGAVGAANQFQTPAAQGPSMTAAQPDTQTYTRTGGNPGGGANTAQLPAAAPTGTQRPAGIAQLAPAPARTLETPPAAPAESVDPFAQRTKDITARELAAAETGLASLKTDLSDEATAMFKGRDERADKREGELEKSKQTNKGMAFLEAGLAMMQSKGRGLAGIAQGAGVGTKAYAAGIDKIKSAQEKLDEARDRTEELRQNQSSMSKREIRAAEGRRDAIVVQGEKDLLTGTRLATGEDRKDFRAALAAKIASEDKDLDRKTKVRVADITAQGMASKLDMDALKARAGILKDQIRLTSTLADRAKLQDQLADINRQLAGGTIGTTSAARAPVGAKFLGFE